MVCRLRRTCSRSMAKTTWTRTSTSITRARRTLRWARTKLPKPRSLPILTGGQYGQLAGAQVTYVTKSGTNQFHGNARTGGTGATLNANNWMNTRVRAGIPGTQNSPVSQTPTSGRLRSAVRSSRIRLFSSSTTKECASFCPTSDPMTAPTPALSRRRRLKLHASSGGIA